MSALFLKKNSLCVTAANTCIKYRQTVIIESRTRLFFTLDDLVHLPNKKKRVMVQDIQVVPKNDFSDLNKVTLM